MGTYDYDRQSRTIYDRDKSMDCGCYGKAHAGELAVIGSTRNQRDRLGRYLFTPAFIGSGIDFDTQPAGEIG